MEVTFYKDSVTRSIDGKDVVLSVDFVRIEVHVTGAPAALNIVTREATDDDKARNPVAYQKFKDSVDPELYALRAKQAKEQAELTKKHALEIANAKAPTTTVAPALPKVVFAGPQVPSQVVIALGGVDK